MCERQAAFYEPYPASTLYGSLSCGWVHKIADYRERDSYDSLTAEASSPLAKSSFIVALPASPKVADAYTDRNTKDYNFWQSRESCNFFGWVLGISIS